MNTKIFKGRVLHRRTAEVEHGFQYPIYFFSFDLAELDAVGQQVTGFGHNRFAPVSLVEADYLDQGSGPLLTRVKDCLKQWPDTTEPHRVELVTSARLFGYVFNPVSFYLLYNESNELTGLLSEVNNTFGDRHLYCCPNLEVRPNGERVGHAAKAFHVSPFFDLSGDYEFRVRQEDGRLAIDVDLIKEGVPALQATQSGESLTLTTGRLWKILLRYPFSAALTIPRIAWQAARLRYQKKLKVYRRPQPADPMTLLRRPPGRLDRFCRKRVLILLRKITRGSLTVIEPDGNRLEFGGQVAGKSTTLTLRDPRFYRRLVFDGEVGLAEAYMFGDAELEDPTAWIELLIDNREALGNGDHRSSRLSQMGHAFFHWLRQNTVANSRKNISAHYDLSNEFFSLFLDPTMNYSCGIFHRPEDSLEAAQRNKMHALIQQARITPDCHVLEIGTGWGGLAMEMVRQTGCRVTSVTISREQYALACERIQTAGLDAYIEVKLCDYRDLEGRFDRIVSVEMLEAVGHRYLRNYFTQCERLLKPDGLLVVQVITLPENRYERYRKNSDFIRKHIFPGGHLPSLKAMNDVIARDTDLHLQSLSNIGPHYAPTLAAWRHAFEAHRERILKMGFDEVFYRKWIFYFCYCEAAFATGTLNVLHLVWSRACNPTLLKEAPHPRSAVCGDRVDGRSLEQGAEG